MACTGDAQRAVGSAGALRGVCLALLVAPSVSCQAISGIGEFTFDAKPSQCPGPPADPGQAGLGICELRKIASLSTVDREVSPGAICEGGEVHIYFQRTITGVRDDLVCATCDAQFVACGEETIIATGVINPYLRRSDPPEIWVSNGGRIEHAALQGCSPIPSFEPAEGVVDVVSEVYPAISPGGTVLYFNRYEDCETLGCNMRIRVATRPSPEGPFEQELVVQTLFADVTIDDLGAQPLWSGERADMLLFSSNRDGDPGRIDALDVYTARTPAGDSDPVDGFTTIEDVPDLSSVNRVDRAPWPFSDSQWLGSFDVAGDEDLYAIDLGCGTEAAP
jgi:hypothetical protein